jgi:protein gp37
MHPDWARGLRDQCAAAGVPFLFKQWGEWHPVFFDTPDGEVGILPSAQEKPWAKPREVFQFPGRMDMERIGKKATGRLLDGILHDGYPEVEHA